MQISNQYQHTRQCDKHWRIGVFMVRILDQHQHTRQRDKHWRIGFLRMQKPQPTNQE